MAAMFEMVTKQAIMRKICSDVARSEFIEI